MFLTKSTVSSLAVARLDETMDTDAFLEALNRRLYRHAELGHGESAEGFSRCGDFLHPELAPSNASGSGLVFASRVTASGAVPRALLKSVVTARMEEQCAKQGVSSLSAKVKREIQEEALEALSDKTETKVREVEFAVDMDNGLLYVATSSGAALDDVQTSLRLAGLPSWKLAPGNCSGVFAGDKGPAFLGWMYRQITTNRSWDAGDPPYMRLKQGDASDGAEASFRNVPSSSQAVSGTFGERFELRELGVSAVPDSMSRFVSFILDTDWTFRKVKFPPDCTDLLTRRIYLDDMMSWLLNCFAEFRASEVREDDQRL